MLHPGRGSWLHEHTHTHTPAEPGVRPRAAAGERLLQAQQLRWRERQPRKGALEHRVLSNTAVLRSLLLQLPSHPGIAGPAHTL